MAEALVSIVLERLALIAEPEIRRELRLVRNTEKEIRSLTSTLELINSVLLDAEKKQITEDNVRLWLEKLKDVSYDIDDALDEWSTAILRLQTKDQLAERTAISRKVCSPFLPPCLSFQKLGQRRNISCQIEHANERLDLIAKERERYNFSIISSSPTYERPRTTSSIDVSKVCGRDDSKNTLIRNLCRVSSREESGIHVLAIVGMGGIGKTTVAQLTYDDNEVKSHFEKQIWVCVSEPFDEIRIAKAIIEALEGTAPNVAELDNILRHMRRSIAGRRFILVLDDVWTEDYGKWEPLRNSLNKGARGSKILVTTRSERVAMVLEAAHTIHLEKMTDEDCWSIFSQTAFSGRSGEEYEKLEEIGWRLVKRCKGLPLAAKILGGLMRFKRSKRDWQSVLDSDLWELEEAKRDIISPLWLSYYDLPSAIKRCFSYCAMFPKDHEIETDKLIQLWMANGFLNSKVGTETEALGQEYFEILAMRSLFQDFVKGDNGRIYRCKMHDVVHDCAQFLAKNECKAIEAGSEAKMASTYAKLRHSMFLCSILGKIVASNKGMHTLLSDYISGLFDHFTLLRALELHGASVQKLPETVGDLKHLRYLGLYSFYEMTELPETVCDLFNLQTLKLYRCSKFEKLPRGIGKLVNLRHIDISIHSPLMRMPKGIGELCNLRTLYRFIVRSKNVYGDGCTIGDLEKLDCLQGVLGITGIGNVTDASEANRAKLKNKKYLHNLFLSFDGSGEEAAEVVGARRDFSTMEALEPPPYLESLEILYYSGTELPSWMSSSSNLKRLALIDCPNLKAFPDNLQAVPLQHLMITKCPKLEALSQGFQSLPLQELRIELCPTLEQRCSVETGDIWPLISHIPFIYVADRRLRKE